MTYVVLDSCVDVLDRSCTETCPVDCIYEGARKLYINPDECIDCGACEPVCPQDAIVRDDKLTPSEASMREDNADFFRNVLRGRATPLGEPGGAADVGPTGVDTDRVRSLPAVTL